MITNNAQLTLLTLLLYIHLSRKPSQPTNIPQYHHNVSGISTHCHSVEVILSPYDPVITTVYFTTHMSPPLCLVIFFVTACCKMKDLHETMRLPIKQKQKKFGPLKMYLANQPVIHDYLVFHLLRFKKRTVLSRDIGLYWFGHYNFGFLLPLL